MSDAYERDREERAVNPRGQHSPLAVNRTAILERAARFDVERELTEQLLTEELFRDLLAAYHSALYVHCKLEPAGA